MNQKLRADAEEIVRRSIREVLPDEAVKRALSGRAFGGRLVLLSIGKAGWQMAQAAACCLGDRIERGLVITKYGHSRGKLPGIDCVEAGHPIPDENSFEGARRALSMVSGLSAEDTVLFLISGGGSALFELPLVPGEELEKITQDLLACGADIVEMNTVRKRLSAVKGGRFAEACAPASVFCVVLSDILGDPLDMIASGPACADKSTCADALAVVEKYGLSLSAQARELLHRETPKHLENVEILVMGSVKELCRAAAAAARERGYEPVILTDQLNCQAREAGAFLASIARSHQDAERPLSFIAGGETVVRLTGKGKGGRNQELALSAAAGISGLPGTMVFSFGSDGTDGPTDAAGGMADGDTAERLRAMGCPVHQVLEENDAYHALKAVDGLIVTGPTGTNVNDVSVVLIKKERALWERTIREYEPSDCKELAELFYHTVHTVNAADYTQEQLKAWASGEVDLDGWNLSFLEHKTLVAVENGQIVGFGDMDGSGYLDRLYVHKDFQGRGIATEILNRLEPMARGAIVTHASITARPFFEGRGYRTVREQQVERRGVLLTNFVMEKGNGIRELRPGETGRLKECLEALSAYHNQVSTCFKGMFPARPYARTLELFEDSLREGASRLAVIEKRGRIAGFCKIDCAGRSGKLDYLVVLEEYRGMGYGKRLMDWAMEEFRRQGIEQIEIKVIDGNRAVHFYESYGFRMQAHILMKMPDGGDAGE